MFSLQDTHLTDSRHLLREHLSSAPQQQRSRDKQKGLLAAGLYLTENRDWDTVTIAEIAAQSGFSVGSFYTRFRNKQSYLDALIILVAEQMQQLMDVFANELRSKQRSAQQIVTAFVEISIDHYARLSGIIRMSILHRQKDTTNPFVGMRMYSCQQFVDFLMPHMQLRGKAAKTRLSFAHQMMNSTLVNAVLTDPGPLHVSDPAFKRETVFALCAYLGFPTTK